MSYRLRMVTALMIGFSLLIVSAFVAESRLAKPLEEQAARLYTSPTGEFDQTGNVSDLDIGFDPIETSVSVDEWRRVDMFTKFSLNLRYGYGPEIAQQVKYPLSDDVIRVAVAGDSYVFGAGAEDSNSRWAMLLEQELNRQTGHLAFEVVPITKTASSSMDVADWVTPERISKLGIDAFILTYGRNDYSPSYHESWICKQFNRCVDDGYDPITTNPLNVFLVDCLKGDDSPTGWFIRNVLNPWFPNLSKSLIDRYCDPDTMSRELGAVPEGGILEDPDNSPYWPNYIESMDRLSRNIGAMPKYALYTGASGSYEQGMVPAHIQLAKSGFEVLLMQNTVQLRRTESSENDLWVNPIDGHPNRKLASAYARDGAQVIIRDFPNIANVQGMSKQRPVISNYLPVQLTISETDPKSMTIILDPRNNKKESWVSEGGRLFQSAPCASLGRPHARVMFDPYRSITAPHSTVTVTLHATEVATLVVPLSYAKDGSQILQQPLRMNPGDTVSLPSDTAGVLLAGLKNGCPKDNDIHMTGFKATFAVQ